MSTIRPLQYYALTALGQALAAAVTGVEAQAVLGLPPNLISAITPTVTWDEIAANGAYTYIGNTANLEIVDAAKAGVTITNGGIGNLVLFDNSGLQNYSLTIKPGETVNFNTVDASGGQFSFTENIRVSIPDASTTQAGRISTGTQSFAGIKTFADILKATGQTAVDPENVMTRALGDARYQLLSVPSIKRTAIIATGTFTYQPETQWAIVELVAGGGGGGGTAAIATGAAAGAEGGNGGGYVMKFVDVGALPSRTVNFVIGAQGLGVSGANGTAGGNSSYSDGVNSLLCYGGSGGSVTNGVSDQSFTGDRAPDAASTGGDVNRPGEPGSGAFQQGATIHTTINARSGRGGGGPFAIGGRAQYARSTSTTPVSSNGAIGLAWGAGGGGACAVNTNSAKIGGNGTAGIAYVLEFP